MAIRPKVYFDIDILDNERSWTLANDEYQRGVAFVKSEGKKYAFSSEDPSEFSLDEEKSAYEIYQSGSPIYANILINRSCMEK
jgi:hypothetical protein